MNLNAEYGYAARTFIKCPYVRQAPSYASALMFVYRQEPHLTHRMYPYRNHYTLYASGDTVMVCRTETTITYDDENDAVLLYDVFRPTKGGRDSFRATTGRWVVSFDRIEYSSVRPELAGFELLGHGEWYYFDGGIVLIGLSNAKHGELCYSTLIYYELHSHYMVLPGSTIDSGRYNILVADGPIAYNPDAISSSSSSSRPPTPQQQLQPAPAPDSSASQQSFPQPVQQATQPQQQPTQQPQQQPSAPQPLVFQQHVMQQHMFVQSQQQQQQQQQLPPMPTMQAFFPHPQPQPQQQQQQPPPPSPACQHSADYSCQNCGQPNAQWPIQFQIGDSVPGPLGSLNRPAAVPVAAPNQFTHLANMVLPPITSYTGLTSSTLQAIPATQQQQLPMLPRLNDSVKPAPIQTKFVLPSAYWFHQRQQELLTGNISYFLPQS